MELSTTFYWDAGLKCSDEALDAMLRQRKISTAWPSNSKMSASILTNITILSVACSSQVPHLFDYVLEHDADTKLIVNQIMCDVTAYLQDEYSLLMRLRFTKQSVCMQKEDIHYPV